MKVSPDKVFRWLVVMIVVLVVADIATQWTARAFGKDHLLGFVRFFDLDEEANLPTWFSSSTLLLCALVLAGIAMAKSAEGDPFRVQWWILSLASVYLSIDETARIHDDLFPNVIRWLGKMNGAIPFLWTPVGIIAVSFFGVSYLKFARALPRATRNEFCVAAVCYVVGIVGFELIGGLYVSLYGMKDFIYVMIVVCEEGLEMLGVALYLRALMRYHRDLPTLAVSRD